MQIRPDRETLQTPERLDTRFGVVAGLYVAALIAPALLLVVVKRLQLGSESTAIGLLGAVVTVCTAVVAWQVTRRGGIVAWFNSTWTALLVPAVGIIPLFVYFWYVFLFIAFTVTDLQPESAANLIGFAGFLSGIAATCLGTALVQMARARIVDETVVDSDVRVEWTAGWPRRDRVRVAIGTLVAVGLPFGLAFWQWGQIVFHALPLGIVLVFSIASLVDERTYRLTPAGLEQRRGTRWFVSRQLTPWSQFDGVSVTDDAVVLHRQLPYIDIRCSRQDLVTHEADVIAALEAHLDRRDL